jgi:hypothetical protein
MPRAHSRKSLLPPKRGDCEYFETPRPVQGGSFLSDAAWAADLDDPSTSLYTFGCPRVGNKAFCDRITAAARAQACYRIVDNEDIVTHIPLLTAGFDSDRPGATLLWFDANSSMIANPPGHPSD